MSSRRRDDMGDDPDGDFEELDRIEAMTRVRPMTPDTEAGPERTGEPVLTAHHPLTVDDMPAVLFAVDRALNVDHRDDDQPCGCDECMAYGAEDEGADWYRIPAANRIVMRALDSGDDRFASLAAAFRDHEADLTPSQPVPSGLDALLAALEGDLEPKGTEQPDYLFGKQAGIRLAIGRVRALAAPSHPLVCALCLFVGDSDDPTPITILNGQLTCEPHSGYFQGGDHVQALIAWKREHPAEGSDRT